MNEIQTCFPINDYRSYLTHHGILGMKWGVRRYQNSDGSLTTAGKKRYSGNIGDADTVSTKRLKSDIKASTKGVRYNFEMSKDLASKESVKTIAKSTQPDYEKLMAAGKKYRQLYDKGKHTNADVDEYTKARDAYQNALKKVANKALGDMKDQEVRFAYDWDGKTYRDGRETLSDTMTRALHQANIERNKYRR